VSEQFKAKCMEGANSLTQLRFLLLQEKREELKICLEILKNYFD